MFNYFAFKSEDKCEWIEFDNPRDLKQTIIYKAFKPD